MNGSRKLFPYEELSNKSERKIAKTGASQEIDPLKYAPQNKKIPIAGEKLKSDGYSRGR
jgi:hypothetical protein